VIKARRTAKHAKGVTDASVIKLHSKGVKGDGKRSVFHQGLGNLVFVLANVHGTVYISSNETRFQVTGFRPGVVRVLVFGLESSKSDDFSKSVVH